MVLRRRELTAEERAAIDQLAHARIAPARRVERTRIIIRHASRGQGAPAIAAQLRLNAATVRGWTRRCNAVGFAGLEDSARGPAADLLPPAA